MSLRESELRTEIERKFLVHGDHWRTDHPKRLVQGYLISIKERSVRVRVDGEQGFLTIKGACVGATRPEYEYPIPLTDAEQLLETLCERPLIEKQRHLVEVDGKTWEVDEFQGENHGLVVAEIELHHEDESFTRPEWIGEEVTSDPKYLNANLAKRPFSTW